jgi:hypothetical protein
MIENVEQLESLSRRELQALAKENNLKANSSNSMLITELSKILSAK